MITNKEINSFAQEHIEAARIGFREVYFIDGQQINQFLIEGEAKVNVLKQK